jgi:hypothetical protein
MLSERELDEQAGRLAHYLGRMGITLTQQRTRQAIVHAQFGAGELQSEVPPHLKIASEDLDLWAMKLGVGADELRDAMLAVGTHLEPVRRYLATGRAFRTRDAHAAQPPATTAS